jgi:hypothetical protein
MFLCIAAGLTLYFTAEAIVKAISWQKKFIRKMNEQQLPPPSPFSLGLFTVYGRLDPRAKITLLFAAYPWTTY